LIRIGTVLRGAIRTRRGVTGGVLGASGAAAPGARAALGAGAMPTGPGAGVTTSLPACMLSTSGSGVAPLGEGPVTGIGGSELG